MAARLCKPSFQSVVAFGQWAGIFFIFHNFFLHEYVDLQTQST